jgi:pimeloyl-ACP methyl ester carboxylesterase
MKFIKWLVCIISMLILLSGCVMVFDPVTPVLLRSFQLTFDEDHLLFDTEHPLKIRFLPDSFEDSCPITVNIYQKKILDDFKFLEPFLLSDSLEILVEQPILWNIEIPFEISFSPGLSDSAQRSETLESSIPVVIYSYGSHTLIDYVYPVEGEDVLRSEIDLTRFFSERSYSPQPVILTFALLPSITEEPISDRAFNDIQLYSYQNGWHSVTASQFLTQDNSLLLIHGFTSSHETFDDMAAALAKALPERAIYAIDYQTSAVFSVPKITEIGDALAKIIQPKGVSLDIIAHSMGGLVARSAIEEHGLDTHINRLITLGTPHDGIELSVILAFIKPYLDFLLNAQVKDLTKYKGKDGIYIDKLNAIELATVEQAYQLILGNDREKKTPYSIPKWALPDKPNDGLVLVQSAGYILPHNKVNKVYPFQLNHSWVSKDADVSKFVSFLLDSDTVSERETVIDYEMVFAMP